MVAPPSLSCFHVWLGMYQQSRLYSVSQPVHTSLMPPPRSSKISSQILSPHIQICFISFNSAGVIELGGRLFFTGTQIVVTTSSGRTVSVPFHRTTFISQSQKQLRAKSQSRWCSHSPNQITYPLQLLIFFHFAQRPVPFADGYATCPICGSRYAQRYNLVRHMKKHSGLTRCPCCHQEFSVMGGLRRHMIRTHDMSKQDVDRITNKRCSGNFWPLVGSDQATGLLEDPATPTASATSATPSAAQPGGDAL